MHDHDHDHDHAPRSAAQRRRLVAALTLAALFMGAEAVGGYLSNSLALWADAGHMLSDAAALGLSLFAVWIANQPPGQQRTFGYHRAEILAALVNGATLIAVSVAILYEAWERLTHPPAIQSNLMLGIAVGGLMVNGIMLWILHGGRHESLNLRGAWLHVLGDTLGSVGVIAAAVCLRIWGWLWVDPVASALIAVLIVYSSWRLVQEALSVLMEVAPASISVQAVRDCLLAAPGVRGVHCLHVWRISSGIDSLSAHVVVDADRNGDAQLQQLHKALQARFDVGHITLQLEPEGFAACRDSELDACSAAPIPAAQCRAPVGVPPSGG
jgi:cobalt-zinc-cadmium efflux system protein